jgi:hypothetical protein
VSTGSRKANKGCFTVDGSSRKANRGCFTVAGSGRKASALLAGLNGNRVRTAINVVGGR